VLQHAQCSCTHFSLVVCLGDAALEGFSTTAVDAPFLPNRAFTRTLRALLPSCMRCWHRNDMVQFGSSCFLDKRLKRLVVWWPQICGIAVYVRRARDYTFQCS
jgi:hypothetical protein